MAGKRVVLSGHSSDEQLAASACHTCLQSGESDWGACLFAHQKLWDFFGDGAQRIIRSGLKRRAKHPDRFAEIVRSVTARL
ncbi:hypothetical protein [Amycolatopsis circi]|uniref:hypothetical protein n=1 Tax=Amycolatopsis circi TaxID=871959 RepID=UPI000E24B65D|nr:hypothetical protein [Amycolatopsis circi]